MNVRTTSKRRSDSRYQLLMVAILFTAILLFKFVYSYSSLVQARYVIHETIEFRLTVPSATDG